MWRCITRNYANNFKLNFWLQIRGKTNTNVGNTNTHLILDNDCMNKTKQTRNVLANVVNFVICDDVEHI